jgi:hypothetical protein
LIPDYILCERLLIRRLSIYTVLDAHILRRNLRLVRRVGWSHCRVCITPRKAAGHDCHPSDVAILDIWDAACRCWRCCDRYSKFGLNITETPYSEASCLLIRICACRCLFRGVVYPVNVRYLLWSFTSWLRHLSLSFRWVPFLWAIVQTSISIMGSVDGAANGSLSAECSLQVVLDCPDIHVKP